MLNIVVWGAGKNCKIILRAIKEDKCNLLGIVDSNDKLSQKRYMDKWLIDLPEKLINKDTDYIIISPKHSNDILQQCNRLGIEKSRIINYWHSNEEYEFIDGNVKRICELEEKLEKYQRQLKNLPYELEIKPVPIIYSSEELLEKIIKEKKSLSRFGDGELEIMQKRERPWFQKVDNKLSARLMEVFNCENEQIIIALADNFGNLDQYTEEAADEIRKYLDNGVREELMNVISLKRIYYDAYVTRPYIIYRNKKRAQYIFELLKQIWKKRDVLLIEGSKAYTGVRNDLFTGVEKIRRIIAPSQNAFSSYEAILSLAKKNVDEKTVVLISLGPTATVLAYDLAMEGIQALDIGQLDNEYEWYLRGAKKRIEIPGKCVSELAHDVSVIEDEEYTQHIIARV